MQIMLVSVHRELAITAFKNYFMKYNILLNSVYSVNDDTCLDNIAAS